MNIRGQEVTYPHVLLIIVCVVTLTLIGFGVGTSSAAFSSYNHGWDGSSDLWAIAETSGSDVQAIRSTAGYQDVTSEQTTAVILGPTDEYTASDTETMSAFIDRGGTVVIAADGRTETNQLLAELQIESRVDGRSLRDDQQHYRNPALPIAAPTDDTTVTENVSGLTLNHGTVVRPSENATVLVNSSTFSYLDDNNNGALDESEPVQQYPVVIREDRGDGRVILVSDASVFINSMLDRPGNQQFAQNLFADAETVVFDHSHSEGVPPVIVLLQIAADSPNIQWLIALVVVTAAAVAWRRSDRPEQFSGETPETTSVDESS